MTEHAPRPEQSIFTEAQSYDSFDAWLSELPDERLQHIVNTIRHIDEDMDDDKEALAQLISVSIYFRGNQPMTPEEIAKSLLILSTQVALEANVRNEVLTKEGVYSMHPDGMNAIFKLTKKGREIYGAGDKA